MENKGIKYVFSAKVCHYSSSGEMGGWYTVCLPKEMAKERRENLKSLSKNGT